MSEIHQYRYKESNKHCVDFGEYTKWEIISAKKLEEIKHYIKRGQNYDPQND